VAAKPSTAKNEKAQRTLPKEVRREQLVRATMRCIAEHGLSGVTMAKVTSTAGLSLGIANLHFESKEKLLLATLRYVTEEYNEGQSGILADPDFPSISAKIDALLEFDFSDLIMEKAKLAVWFAFLGEAKSRPTYQKICGRMDNKAEELLTRLFQEAIDDGNYKNVDASVLAGGYISLVDGLWLNALLAPRRMSRKKSRIAARQYLATALPRHVNASDS
jgi:TetR/AcrR family transcriptional regulator, transcriptional repressor of bet genes